MNGSIKDTSLSVAIMFAYKHTQSLKEHPNIIQAATFGAFTLEMNDSGTGEIIIFVMVTRSAGCFLYTVAEVDILGIHKKSLIKAANAVEYLLADHHKRTCQYIYPVRCIFIKMSEMI